MCGSKSRKCQTAVSNCIDLRANHLVILKVRKRARGSCAHDVILARDERDRGEKASLVPKGDLLLQLDHHAVLPVHVPSLVRTGGISGHLLLVTLVDKPAGLRVRVHASYVVAKSGRMLLGLAAELTVEDIIIHKAPLQRHGGGTERCRSERCRSDHE
jgi:hypothetical protein